MAALASKTSLHGLMRARYGLLDGGFGVQDILTWAHEASESPTLISVLVSTLEASLCKSGVRVMDPFWRPQRLFFHEGARFGAP